MLSLLSKGAYTVQPLVKLEGGLFFIWQILSGTYFVPGTVLGARNTAMPKVLGGAYSMFGAVVKMSDGPIT